MDNGRDYITEEAKGRGPQTQGFIAGEPKPLSASDLRAGSAYQQERRILRVEERMRYHAPTPEQLPKYQALRDAASAFARVIVRNTPDNGDSEQALAILEACLMTANKSIALG